ncbi:DUF1287 domain-containing protein [Methylopila sp. M107]|uniref:DUF1287 domain-containing protein n=1 Tax=Methylopila sp. M107 TaxID=1101190 RepID=UPI0003778CA7|nr:DUF1287 domain-containing protein [Methylopila sp. M107]
MPLDRRAMLAALAATLVAPRRGLADPADWTARLVSAAEAQLGVTTIYDPAYVALSYPGGDVAPERGVCTDVVVRAYRAAFGLDLQKLVHEDMAAAFSAYPKSWGVRRPDRNIDHRRVPNLETFFRRRGAALPATTQASDYGPGDLVTQRLPGELPHIAIVTAKRSSDGARPLLLHNIGSGARIEDTLFAFRIVGRFRFPPSA